MHDIRFLNESGTVTPSASNLHNYMLDTCAVNAIVKNISDLDLLKLTTAIGYKYYATDVQFWELHGFGAKTFYHDYFAAEQYKSTKRLQWLNQKRPLFAQVFESLSVQRVSYIVTSGATSNWTLGDNVRFFDDSKMSSILFSNLYKMTTNSKAYQHDAIIAESAMENNCILVTTDGELITEVEKLFPGRAISYNDFLEAALKQLDMRDNE